MGFLSVCGNINILDNSNFDWQLYEVPGIFIDFAVLAQVEVYMQTHNSFLEMIFEGSDYYVLNIPYL